MANGLDAGDSIKGSDTFKFFRGERSEQSPGERDVPFSELVTYLNTDESGLTGGGGGGTWGSITGSLSAQTDLQAQLDRLDALEKNLGINFLRDAVAESWTIFDMVDGFADEYADQSGVNLAASVNEDYDSGGNSYGVDATGPDFLLQSGSGDSGQTFADSTGTHTVNLGAASNVTHDNTESQWSPNSIRFQGSNDNLVIPRDANNLDFDFGSGSFTIETWIRFDNVGLNECVAIKGDNGSGEASWKLYCNSNGQIQYYYSFDGTTLNGPVATGNNVVTSLTWHHVAWVFDSGNSLLNIYVDGTRESSTAYAGTLHASSLDMSIGTNLAQTEDFTGYMEDFAVTKGVAKYTAADETAAIPSAPLALTVPNLTLVGDVQTASSAPSYARMVVLHEPIDTVTLNTDLILEISMDGGSTYSTPFTLTKEANYDSSVEILTTDEILLDSTSGTDIVYKITTANNKNQNIHGVWAQWR